MVAGPGQQTPNESIPALRPIVLTTDFGVADPYAGVMRGVILGINPQAQIIDLTHQIRPQNIVQAGFVLGTNYPFFPTGSIHVAVVDPGVGTDRRALLLVTPKASFLAPDNGILSYVIRDYLGQTLGNPGLISLPSGLTAYSLTASQYWLHPVSKTFHGRDIFGPVAAHLSLGVEPNRFGQPVNQVLWLPISQPAVKCAAITGEVIYADHFGNLVTNIPEKALRNSGFVQVEIKGRRISRLSQTFHPGEGSGEETLVALVGSHGYLEVAVPNGSAAGTLGADIGTLVYVTVSAAN